MRELIAATSAVAGAQEAVFVNQRGPRTQDYHALTTCYGDDQRCNPPLTHILRLAILNIAATDGQISAMKTARGWQLRHRAAAIGEAAAASPQR